MLISNLATYNLTVKMFGSNNYVLALRVSSSISIVYHINIGTQETVKK